MPKKILAVDDEGSVRELLIAILQPEGYEVTTVSSGQECLEALQTLKPDLIIMDIMMPQVSGIETIEKIRANPGHKDTTIICLTVVRRKEQDEEKLKGLDVRDYIHKPFENYDLVTRVKKILG